MAKKFIWYKPEDWKELHSTCYDNVLYLNKKKSAALKQPLMSRKTSLNPLLLENFPFP